MPEISGAGAVAFQEREKAPEIRGVRVPAAPRKQKVEVEVAPEVEVLGAHIGTELQGTKTEPERKVEMEREIIRDGVLLLLPRVSRVSLPVWSRETISPIFPKRSKWIIRK